MLIHLPSGGKGTELQERAVVGVGVHVVGGCVVEERYKSQLNCRKVWLMNVLGYAWIQWVRAGFFIGTHCI